MPIPWAIAKITKRAMKSAPKPSSAKALQPALDFPPLPRLCRCPPIGRHKSNARIRGAAALRPPRRSAVPASPPAAPLAIAKTAARRCLRLVGHPHAPRSARATRRAPPRPSRRGRPAASESSSTPVTLRRPPRNSTLRAPARPSSIRARCSASRFSTSGGGGPKRSLELVADRPQLARLAGGGDAAVDVDLRRLEGDEGGRQVGVDRDVEAHRLRRLLPRLGGLARPRRPPRRSSGSRARSRPRRRGPTAPRRAGRRRRGCRGRASRS